MQSISSICLNNISSLAKYAPEFPPERVSEARNCFPSKATTDTAGTPASFADSANRRRSSNSRNVAPARHKPWPGRPGHAGLQPPIPLASPVSVRRPAMGQRPTTPATRPLRARALGARQSTGQAEEGTSFVFRRLWILDCCDTGVKLRSWGPPSGSNERSADGNGRRHRQHQSLRCCQQRRATARTSCASAPARRRVRSRTVRPSAR